MALLQQLLHLSFFVLMICTARAINPEAEALLRWKSTLIATNLSSWSLADPACSWFGVTCDAGGHVTELRLSNAGLIGTLHGFYSAAFQNITKLYLDNNHLVGAIPANISLLLTLTVLDLSSNNLEGFITNCTNVRMRTLDLRGNNFSGPIPVSLPEMVPRLRYLDLSYNGFSGPIPRSLSRLRKLNVLWLHMNILTGGIPEELGMISGLQFLSLSNNLLGGSIPASLGKLQMLEALFLGGAGLVSTLPPEMGNLTSLKVIDLSRNQLFGSLPCFAKAQRIFYFAVNVNNLNGSIHPEMFANWTNPRIILDFSSNLFSGSIPPQISNLSSLEYLDISSNHLEGELPATMASLRSLVYLSLSGNMFTGTISNLNDRQLPIAQVSNNSFLGDSRSTFCELKLLQFLDLSHNQIFGELPHCIWNLEFLQFMDLSTNGLVGNVPTITNSSSSLVSLHLSNNRFTGCFPAVLKNFKKLAFLDLGNNKISGTIRTWMPQSNPFLRILRLRSNVFHGSIPWQLSQLSRLQLLDLAENNFTGTIPTSFTNLSSMRQPSMMQPFSNIDLTDGIILYFYDGQVDIFWKGLDYTIHETIGLMTGIDLSSNSLSGVIPSKLTSLIGLRFLNLSRNHLLGSIPKDTGNLTLLESLDLSWNKLSGHIPSSMSYLLYLSSLNLSNNNLSGEIPTGNQLRTLIDPSIYSNNPELCGFPLSIDCTNHSSSTTILDGVKEHHQDLETMCLYYSIIAGVVFGFWLWFGVLFFCKSRRFAFFNSIDAMQDKVVQKMEHI